MCDGPDMRRYGPFAGEERRIAYETSPSRIPKEAQQIRFGDCYARDAGVPLMGRHGMERAGSERRFQIRQYHESGTAIGF